MIHTKEEAMCRLLLLQPTPENILIAERKLEALGEVELCYDIRPDMPIIVKKDDSNNPDYKHYLPAAVKLPDENTVISFINTVYRADNPVANRPADEGKYELEDVQITDILKLVQRYSNLFDTSYTSSFTFWCRTKRLAFLDVADNVVVNTQTGTRVPDENRAGFIEELGTARELYVLRQEHHAGAIIDIKDTQDNMNTAL